MNEWTDRNAARHSGMARELPSADIPFHRAMIGKRPLSLPARELLKLPGKKWITWAVFDADWYRATYLADTAPLVGALPDRVLEFYLETGQSLYHSPNMLFDEDWHRRAYPAIAALVQTGKYPSAFDAYCRGGCLDRSPHWLFDEAEYRRRNPDLTDAVLAERGLVNGYDHYLWRGSAEGRIAHMLFDPSVYLAHLPPAEADAASTDGPFRHYLQRLDRRAPEVPTSLYFDPTWYRQRYPEVADAIDRGTWRCALEHYLCNDTPTAFDPNPAFSEAYYVAHTPNVAGMIEHRHFRNGYAHFLRHGLAEGRSPSEPIDLAWYAKQETVRQEIDEGSVSDAFAHWLTIGQLQGLRSAPLPQQPITEAQAKALFRERARLVSVSSSRMGLNFRTASEPALSVIMVLHNQFDLTMMALSSLRTNYPGDIQLILVDSGSNDETKYIESRVHGAHHLRFDSNIGYLRGCNAALTIASADVVVYLHNDIELGPGAIAAALHRLTTNSTVGAVGGMILRTHNVLQEAGSIVWCDGSTQGYMRDASPLAPEANFVRDVDFCSGVFLMARRELLFRLGGFDEAFAPAYYEDVDLCFRITQAGYRVVYDPAVVVHHVEYGSATDSHAAETEMRRAHQIFALKHVGELANRRARGGGVEVFARMTDASRRRVLFMEDTVPLRMIGSGFIRSNDLVTVMASMGYEITIYPLNGCAFDLSTVYADMPDNVEVMYNHSIERLQEFLAARQDYYNVIWIARTHNLEAVRPILERVAGASGNRPRVVLDTEAIASFRDLERAALAGQTFDADVAIRQELSNGPFCDEIVAVTESEAAAVREIGLVNVAVIGHMRALNPTPRPVAERTGMLFVGAIHRMDSPNYDGLCWFIDEVLPLVDKQLGWRTRLTVVGYTSADVSLDRFRDHPRVTLRGRVSNLASLYDSHRLFVAPTRIAAGTPYKICEAASFGLPVVATRLLRTQLGWVDDQELLTAEAADPAAFAKQVVTLHTDDAVWQRLRSGALERLRLENSRSSYEAAIESVLGLPQIANPLYSPDTRESLAGKVPRSGVA
ncbi:MAG TPA: glycosyl transferase family 2 [Acetobacteraceae bacterium]|jgi:O-antigen biosynthesis protein|nr:glycosyl transferase family 2 [Acetobacteraceae bacterium]